MRRTPPLAHDCRVTSPRALRWTVVLPALAWVLGSGMVVGIAATTNGGSGVGEAWLTVVQTLPPVLLGLLVLRRVPTSPAGPALVFLAAAPALTLGVERLGASSGSPDPWPGATLAAAVAPGVWVFNLAGFVLLCLVFPDGRLPGRRWAAMPWVFLAVALALNAAMALDDRTWAEDGSRIPGSAPLGLPDGLWLGVVLLTGLAPSRCSPRPSARWSCATAAGTTSSGCSCGGSRWVRRRSRSCSPPAGRRSCSVRRPLSPTPASWSRSSRCCPWRPRSRSSGTTSSTSTGCSGRPRPGH